MPVKWNKDAKGQWFDGNPQNINRNGRPKKTVSIINSEMLKKGYEPVTQSQIQDAYLQIMNLDTEELQAMSHREDLPFLYKIVIKHLLKDKWYEVLEKMLDRSIGKATQKVEQTITGDLEVKVPE